MNYTLQCTTSTPIETALTIADVVEISWGVVAVLTAAYIWKQLMRVP
jgi:hypothetical protein